MIGSRRSPNGTPIERADKSGGTSNGFDVSLRTGDAPATALEGFAWRRFVAEGVDGAVEVAGDMEDDEDVERDTELERDVDVDVEEPPARDAPPSRAPAGSDALDTPPLPSESVP
jgi:hypothetical protein